MTVRFAAAAAAVLATVTALESPAQAGETRAFDAWGHTFIAADAPLARREAFPADVSTAPRRAYTSTQADAGVPGTPAVRTQPARTLNVWGARIDVSAE